MQFVTVKLSTLKSKIKILFETAEMPLIAKIN